MTYVPPFRPLPAAAVLAALLFPAAGAAQGPDDGPPFADYGGKPIDDWSRVLPDLLPAIRACMAEADIATRSVVKAWPMNRGMVGVRLRTSGGGLHDCVATSGGKVESVDALPEDAEPLPGQGEPVFLPARDTPPRGVTCGRLERVSGPQGEAVAGYLRYDSGCDNGGASGSGGNGDGG